MRRLPLRLLVLAALVPLLLAVLAAWVVLGGLPASGSPTAVGRAAPGFSVVDLDGNEVTLADFRGQPVIVNFWASWCRPCVEEFPLLAEAAERHADDGLVIIGIVFDDGADAARAFADRHEAAWTVAMDPDASAAAAYRVLGPPETYFVRPDGTIAARQIGQLSQGSLDEKLAAIIDEP